MSATPTTPNPITIADIPRVLQGYLRGRIDAAYEDAVREGVLKGSINPRWCCLCGATDVDDFSGHECPPTLTHVGGIEGWEGMSLDRLVQRFDFDTPRET